MWNEILNLDFFGDCFPLWMWTFKIKIRSLGPNVTSLVRVVFLYANKYKVFNSLCILILRLNIVKCHMKNQAQTPTAWGWHLCCDRLYLVTSHTKFWPCAIRTPFCVKSQFVNDILGTFSCCNQNKYVHGIQVSKTIRIDKKINWEKFCFQ